MEYCKYCQTELSEHGSFCPKCGKNNDPNAAASEEALPEQEPGKKETAVASPGKIALCVAAIIVLAAVMIAFVINGLSQPEATALGTDTVPTTQATVSAEATVPAGTGLDNVTCKGTYTVSDEIAIAEADTVVATWGEYELTNAQLQVFYWLQVQDFLSANSYYLSYYGLDYTQPLDVQSCIMAEGYTWQQYFLEGALEAWQGYQSLSCAAEENGEALATEYQQYLDNLPVSMEEDAIANGFANAKELIACNVGPGAELEDYVHFLELYYLGYQYFSNLYTNYEPSFEEIDAYFTENEASYADSGITRDSGNYVDVRHILVLVEGGTADETGAVTYSEEEWETCRAQAQAILDEWLAGEATEDSFAALANEKSEDPGSNTVGGLYENVYLGQMVEPFETWCFDETRQYGHYGLVQTSYGYHVMFFVDSIPIWQAEGKTGLTEQYVNDATAAASSKHEALIDYEKIVLGFVDMAS